MKNKKLFLIAGLLFLAGPLYSQVPYGAPVRQRFPQQKDSGFSVHIGGALPMGRVAQKEVLKGNTFLESGRLSANIGFTAGVKGKLSLSPNNGLGAFVSADLVYNKAGQDYYDPLTEAGLAKAGNALPVSVNIPLFVGLNYRYDRSAKLGIWVEGGFGPNFRMISNSLYSRTQIDNTDNIPMQYTYRDKATFNTKTTFGGQIGFGFIFSNCISIGLHYYMLGNAEYEGNHDNEKWTVWDEMENGVIQQKVIHEVFHQGHYSSKEKFGQSNIFFRVGYHF